MLRSVSIPSALSRRSGLLAAGLLLLLALAGAPPAHATNGTARPGSSPFVAWSPTTSPGTYNYPAGAAQAVTFTLTNSSGSGTSALTVSLTGSPAFQVTADDCTGTSLGPGKASSVTVQYTPPASGGAASATLRVVSQKPFATTSLQLTAIASPSLTTAAGGTVALGSGGKLTASATLSGAYLPTGTINFSLYDSNNILVYTDAVTVSGDGSYTTASGSNPGGFLPTAMGTYQWTATYSGDGSNNAAQTALGAAPETVTGVAMTATPSPASVTLGDGTVTLNDTAVLSGGSSPTGTLTFELYAPDGTLVYTNDVIVSGTGTYHTSAIGDNPGGYTLPTNIKVTGTYQWSVTYSGDSNNKPLSDLSDPAEQVTVNAASLQLRATGTLSEVQGTDETFSATFSLAGGYFPAGTIVFYLEDLNHQVLRTITATTVNGNGTYPASVTLPTSDLPSGGYSVDFEYVPGDDNNIVIIVH